MLLILSMADVGPYQLVLDRIGGALQRGHRTLRILG
jgi:hypothetical protein